MYYLELEYLKERNAALTLRCEERETEILELRGDRDKLRLEISMLRHPTNPERTGGPW